MYGNFIKDEYLHTLRLKSKLADLRAANANPYPENLAISWWGDEIWECGARVICVDIIPLFVRIQCNISALPQYLARFAARYANPLRLLDFCKFARIRIAQVGSRSCEARTKKKSKKDIQKDVRLYGNQPHLARSPQETMRLCFEPSDIRR